MPMMVMDNVNSLHVQEMEKFMMLILQHVFAQLINIGVLQTRCVNVHQDKYGMQSPRLAQAQFLVQQQGRNGALVPILVIVHMEHFLILRMIHVKMLIFLEHGPHLKP